MSAQDDLLAAFGEPLPPRQKQPTEPAEEPTESAAEATESAAEPKAGEVAEAAEAAVAAEAPKAAEAAETTVSTEAPQAAEAVETTAATEAPAATPADSQPEVMTQQETVVLPAESAAQPEPAAPADTTAQTEAATLITAQPEPEALPEAATVIVEPPAPETAATQAAPQASIPADTPQFPHQPYLDPAAFFAQLQNESAIPAPPAKRRWPRLLLRYASALVLAGAVGVGTGYAVTVPKRTDVPFLATASDGRHTFPGMLRPAPPAGKPAPAASDNDAQIHYADLRQYLVAAPIGLKATEDGWESVKDFEATLSGTNLPDHLTDQGLRHVARRGWRTADGQHTVVELLQFPDKQSAYAMAGTLDTASQAHAGKARDVVPQLTVTSLGDLTFKAALRTFDEVDGMPGQRERRVVFESGDVVAIVTTTAPAAVPDVPTEQVVLLQAQMLR